MFQFIKDAEMMLRQCKQLSEKFHLELERLPRGSLSAIKRGDKTYFYHNFWKDGKRIKLYLTPKRPESAFLIQQLKRRRFIQKSLAILDSDIKLLSGVLKNFRPYNPQDIAETLPKAYQEVPADKDLWLPSEPDLQNWAREPYEKSSFRPETLIHETISGIRVRSKSEAMIADMLFHFQIPFRYEPIIRAANKTYAPDFEILRLRDRQKLYWEHLGLLDKPDYVLENATKLLNYRQAGITAGNNLILTLEDKAHPLTSREILDIIRSRLL